MIYRILRRELAGRRPGGRARRTFMDGVKEDVEMVGVREEDAEGRARWRQAIGCDPRREEESIAPVLASNP